MVRYMTPTLADSNLSRHSVYEPRAIRCTRSPYDPYVTLIEVVRPSCDARGPASGVTLSLDTLNDNWYMRRVR